MEILGRGGFEGGLDLVEVKISKGEISDAELLYKDLLKLLHENPHSMSRILHLCAHFGDYEGMEKVIDVLGGHRQCPNDRQRYESKRFGIGNAEVAKMLALAIQTHGWEVCGSLIEEKLLLWSRISHECESYANLALEFQSIGMHAAAVSIAKKIGTLIQNLQGIITELTDSDVVAILIMLFKLPECHGELAPSLVDKIIKEATDITLGRVVTKLRDAGSRDVSDAWSKKYFCLKENRVLLDLFIKICRGLTTRELKVPEKPLGLYSKYTEHKASKEIKKCIVEVMETFLWLEDMSLLEGMVKSIVSQSQKCKNQWLLKEIIESSGFSQTASCTELGKSALRNLVKERICRLESEHKPVFSWCQPSATLPGHPEVEALLRGPLGLPDARDFAKKYFGGWMSRCGHDAYGFSATAQEGGKGRAAYCTIVKTRRVFEEMERQWDAGRRELARLQPRLQELQGTKTQDESGGQAFNNMDSMAEGECASGVNKRLKTDGESIGSSKKHPIFL
ncbi:hypothetical protein GOP47_0009147 [Adiantum capillus-veneris]|uniref:Uncharacterized protein n=1 Tax=Adiantum capillus-veneris TaxID=13818 RepID=A0A9D4V149_ADICA|nr:hypothetical protein GOP47_0009147 [Adiantum capillus-veneris]